MDPTLLLSPAGFSHRVYSLIFKSARVLLGNEQKSAVIPKKETSNRLCIIRPQKHHASLHSVVPSLRLTIILLLMTSIMYNIFKLACTSPSYCGAKA